MPWEVCGAGYDDDFLFLFRQAAPVFVACYGGVDPGLVIGDGFGTGSVFAAVLGFEFLKCSPAVVVDFNDME